MPDSLILQKLEEVRQAILDGGGGGGGSGTSTEYTEDAAAAANPVGGVVILRRRDALSAAEVSTDGDNIAANASPKGELYVKHVDAIPVTLAAGAAAIAKAEDAAAADGDTGVPFLAVRRATPANSSSTDGDYEFAQISGGRLWGSTIVTDIVPGVGATSLGKAEDAVHGSGDTGVMALGVRKDTPTALSNLDGDYSPFIVDALGRMFVRAMIVDASDNPVAWTDTDFTFSSPADAGFTRPADTTPYAEGDLIANSVTAGSVSGIAFAGATKTGAGGSGQISKVKFRTSAVIAQAIRVHFLKTNHAVTNGDNGALLFTSLDIDNYIGSVDISAVASGRDSIGSGGSILVSKALEQPLDYELASGDTIYAFIQALAAFTPGNAATYGLDVSYRVAS